MTGKRRRPTAEEVKEFEEDGPARLAEIRARKVPGKTIAESLGIEVADDAPGGQAMMTGPVAGGQRSTRQHHVGADIEWDGHYDVDGHGRSEG